MKRAIAHIITLLFTALLLVALALKTPTADYLLWSVPHITASCSIGIFLILSLLTHLSLILMAVVKILQPGWYRFLLGD